MTFGRVVAGLLLLMRLQSVAGQMEEEREREPEQPHAAEVHVWDPTEQHPSEDRKGSLPESQSTYQEQAGPNTMDLSSDFSM